MDYHYGRDKAAPHQEDKAASAAAAAASNAWSDLRGAPYVERARSGEGAQADAVQL